VLNKNCPQNPPFQNNEKAQAPNKVKLLAKRREHTYKYIPLYINIFKLVDSMDSFCWMPVFIG
jgi:hypothetical protein